MRSPLVLANELAVIGRRFVSLPDSPSRQQLQRSMQLQARGKSESSQRWGMGSRMLGRAQATPADDRRHKQWQATPSWWDIARVVSQPGLVIPQTTLPIEWMGL